MHQYKSQHGVVDVGADLIRSIGRGHPVGSRNASGDRVVQRGDSWLGV